MMNRLRDCHLPLLLAALLTGCSHLGYYAQAVSGHFEVMRAATPISDLVDNPASDPRLRQQLAEVQAMRDFASRELGLPDNDSYRAYADLGRPYVVWNVFAAPEFSLHARRWCLLVVGCVSYRGYYDRRAAEQLAAELRQQGYETFLGGVPAYSTLGYFDDPVLNTFLRLGSLEVARTVFHELAHQVVFVQGDTRFNESFATAVENEGLRRWLARHATPEQRAAFAVQRARRAAFMALLRDYGKRFEALYESPNSISELRVAKAGLLATLRRDYAGLKVVWGGYAGYDAFLGDGLNNATFASLSLYSELVPAFEVLLARQNHDLPQFYQEVASLAALGNEARQDRLQELLAASGQARQEPSDVAVGVMDDSLRLAHRACSGCPQ